MGTRPTTESRCVQTRPDLRGNLKPPTLDLFCLFRFRVPRTGHDFLFDETPLDPHCERRMATFFLYKRACEDYFLHARLRAVERVATLAWEVGRTLVCVARWRPSERGLQRISP